MKFAVSQPPFRLAGYSCVDLTGFPSACTLSQFLVGSTSSISTAGSLRCPAYVRPLPRWARRVDIFHAPGSRRRSVHACMLGGERYPDE